MHRSRVPLRRLLFALAVPVVAIGGVALTAGVAASSTGAAPAATDAPSGGGGGGGGFTQLPKPKVPPFSFKTFTFKTGSPSSKPATKSPSATPSGSKSPSATPSGSASPSASGSGGVAPVPGGGAGSGCAATVSPPVTVQIGTVGGKQALVDQAGCAVYLDTKDNPTTSACDATCLQTWPAVPGPGKAGTGVQQANLATFTRTDGTVQLTFFGKQLYHFTGDASPGDANGQGMDQTFYLVDKSGNPIIG